jgi:selenocysteine lyase/cysteine desulfurase
MTATIYLNHAGTSWPKPEPVREAAGRALEAEVEGWAVSFEEAHASIARFFGVEDPSRLLLTPGCTSALAAGVANLPWQAGDRVLTSGMEHHALHRPLCQLEERGVDLIVAPRGRDGPIDLDVVERELARGVGLLAISGAANTTGERLPIEELAERAHAHGALLLVDAAQIAGWEDIDVRTFGCDLLAFAGHNALQGVWGIGGLYVAPHVDMHTPDYCDTGSVDRAALAALHAAVAWLGAPERAGRLARAREQVATIEAELRAHTGVRVLGAGLRMPTVSFVVEGRSPADVATVLRAQGVVASGGHQCAPLAHRSLGTAPDGAVRLSVGPQTRSAEVARVLEVLRDVLG